MDAANPDGTAATPAYVPNGGGLTFHDKVPAFTEGSDTPRAFLERCLAVIAAKEPALRAWVVLNEAGARAAADDATARYRSNRPLSPIDGMPVGVKDLMETRDMPTQLGCEAFAGNFPKRDTALVRGLREAGAVLVGKTVTAELGGAGPGPTVNPWDRRRTPGGSSSGTAAAVAADMVPAAMGSQLAGSIIRPAGYCGNYAHKPTQGALNRGERQGYSQSTAGVHANCPEDMWRVAMAIVRRVGGDPGHPGLFGPDHAPAASRPSRLVVLETEGWATLDDASREAFERLLAALRQAGVAVLRRTDDPAIARVEEAVADATTISREITAFEARWSLENLVEQHATGLSRFVHAQLATARQITLDRYRQRLQQRADAASRMGAASRLGDGFITLSAPGPAPAWDPDAPGAALNTRPTGVPSFNVATSMLGMPAVTVPLLASGGLPLGVQIVCEPHGDARATAIARWMGSEVAPISVPG